MSSANAREIAREACRAYSTAELTTVNPGGFPVTVPVVTAFDETSGKIVFSTSIAYPAKVRNIRKNPLVALHFHNRVALRPEFLRPTTAMSGSLFEEQQPQSEKSKESGDTNRSRKGRDEPPSYVIRARATVLDLGFLEALASIGLRFQGVRLQPSLYRRLSKHRWARLYKYYFSRFVIEAEPQEIVTLSSLQNVTFESASREKILGRPAKPLRRIHRLILRHSPAASLAVVDPLKGPLAAKVRVQAVSPTLICAEISPEPQDPGKTASATPERLWMKACISAFGQSPDLGYLFQCCALGVAEISGAQTRLSPIASFASVRPPGLIGDLWSGVDSTRKGKKNASLMGVGPISEETLVATFGGK